MLIVRDSVVFTASVSYSEDNAESTSSKGSKSCSSDYETSDVHWISKLIWRKG